MNNDNTKTIKTAIEALRTEKQAGAVTPQVEAALLDKLLEKIDADDAALLEEAKAADGVGLNARMFSTYMDLYISDKAGQRLGANARIANANAGYAGLMTSDQFLALQSWALTLQNAGGKSFTPAKLDDAGKLPASVIPASIPTVGNVADIVLRDLFNTAVQTDYEYRDLELNSDGIAVETGDSHPNGYDENGECHLYGLNLPPHIARQVFTSRWILGTGGAQLSTWANVPLAMKSTDSRIDMSYTACNNWSPRAICIGARGWDSEVAPVAMHRAFDNAPYLNMIVGIISLSEIKSESDMFRAFKSVPRLSRFLIKDVPRQSRCSISRNAARISTHLSPGR